MIWVHRILWVVMGIVVFMLIPIIRAEHDILLSEAEATATANIMMQLPIEALGSIKVYGKDI